MLVDASSAGVLVEAGCADVLVGAGGPGALVGAGGAGMLVKAGCADVLVVAGGAGAFVGAGGAGALGTIGSGRCAFTTTGASPCSAASLFLQMSVFDQHVRKQRTVPRACIMGFIQRTPNKPFKLREHGRPHAAMRSCDIRSRLIVCMLMRKSPLPRPWPLLVLELSPLLVFCWCLSTLRFLTESCFMYFHQIFRHPLCSLVF